MGTDETLPSEIGDNLGSLTKEQCESLTVTQIKRIRVLIDEAIVKNNDLLLQLAKDRDDNFEGN